MLYFLMLQIVSYLVFSAFHGCFGKLEAVKEVALCFISLPMLILGMTEGSDLDQSLCKHSDNCNSRHPK